MDNSVILSTCMEQTDLSKIFNRNERRVKNIIADIVEREGLDFTAKDIQDAYALSLNNIPPHYVHKGTIVLHPNISTDEIQTIVRDVLTQVLHITKP